MILDITNSVAEQQERDKGKSRKRFQRNKQDKHKVTGEKLHNVKGYNRANGVFNGIRLTAIKSLSDAEALLSEE